MNSGTRLRTEIIPASGQIVIGSGNFFFLTATGAAVTVSFQRGGTSFGAENVTAGYIKGLVDPWDRATLTGTAGASVTFFSGFEELTEDFTDYRAIVGTFLPQQPATISDAADVDVGSSGVAVQVAAANAARRRVTIKLNQGATVNIRVGANGTVAAGRGIQLEGGQSITIESTARIDAIREGAGTAVVSIVQEGY